MVLVVSRVSAKSIVIDRPAAPMNHKGHEEHEGRGEVWQSGVGALQIVRRRLFAGLFAVALVAKQLLAPNSCSFFFVYFVPFVV
jgi:hypothetical protein